MIENASIKYYRKRTGTLKFFLAVILSLLNVYGVCRAGLGANGIPHVSATITLDRHFECGRRRDDPERTHHHTHPASDAGGLVNVNQAGLRISAHGPVGARIQTGSLFTMSTLEGKVLSFDKDPGYRLRFFVYGQWQRFGHRRNFRSAPKLALMASRAFLWVHFDNLQFYLLIILIFLIIFHAGSAVIDRYP